MSSMPIRYGVARPTFFNDGRFYGWDNKHEESKGEMEEVRVGCFDNHIDSDSHCLRFQQTYDPEYRGRYHSEVVLQNATQHGKATYYGFAFKLSKKNWQFDESFSYGPKVTNNRVAIAQFITHFRDVDCGEKNKKGAVPTTMVWIQNDKLYVRLRSGAVCQEDKGDVREFKIGQVTPGEWHTLAFGVLWHKEKEGWFKVWLDNKLRIDKEDIKTFLDTDDRMFQFRVGIYPNWWTWDGSGHPFIKDGLKRKREIFIDHIGFGPELADADPWSSVVTENSVQTKIKTLQTFVRRMKRDNPAYNVAAELDLLVTLKEQLADIVIKKDPATGNAMKAELLREATKRSKNSHKSEPNIAYKPVVGSGAVTNGESEGVEDEDENAKGSDGLPITGDEVAVDEEVADEETAAEDQEQKEESAKDEEQLTTIRNADEDESGGEMDKDVKEEEGVTAGSATGEDETEKGESSAVLKAAISGDGEATAGTGTEDGAGQSSQPDAAVSGVAGDTSVGDGSAQPTTLKEKGVSDESGESPAVAAQPATATADSADQGASKDQADQRAQDADEVAHFKGVDANTLMKLTGQAPPEEVEPTVPPTSSEQANSILKSLEYDVIFFIVVVGILYYLFQPFSSQEVVPPRMGGGSSHGQPKRDDATIALTHLERGNAAPIVDEKNA